MTDPSAPRYPGYDVLDKRHTPSWDAVTRRVIDHRLAVPREPRFFTPSEWATADAVCQRIVPQPANRPPVPLVALLDAKLLANVGDGFREGDMPYMREAWRQGLAAIETESGAWHGGRAFAILDAAEKDALLRMMHRGELSAPAWDGLGAKNFFTRRILSDIPGLYYSHPTAWSEMGFGGPASPRGYVRMDLDRRDPWEAAYRFRALACVTSVKSDNAMHPGALDAMRSDVRIDPALLGDNRPDRIASLRTGM